MPLINDHERPIETTASSRVRLGHGIIREFGGVWWLVGVIVVALASATLVLMQGSQPSDDAHITFRHVRNLLEHGRPAWNLSGVPVLGSTSPLYMMILAAWCFLFRTVDVPLAALHVNVAAHFATVIFGHMVMRDLVGRSWAALGFAAVIGVNALNVHIATQGFEGTSFTLIVLVCLFASRRGFDFAAVVLASLAPLVRPEGVILTPIVWGVIGARRQFAWGKLVAFVGVPIAWLTLSISYYGSPIPHSITAKRMFPAIYSPFDGAMVDPLDRLKHIPGSASHLLRDSVGPLVLYGDATDRGRTWLESARAGVILAGLPLAVFVLLRRCAARGMYLALAPMQLLMTAWIGHWQAWYFPSLVTLTLLILWGGWASGLHRLSMTVFVQRLSPSVRWLATTAAYIVIFAAFISVNDYRVQAGAREFAHQGAVFPVHPWGMLAGLAEQQRALQYRLAAEFLNGRTEPTARAMISEVGVFGYHFHGEVIDTVGLCSPEALAFYPLPRAEVYDADGHLLLPSNNITPWCMVDGLQPDFVVNSRYYLFTLLRPGSDFLEKYEEIQRFGIVWGEPLVIYQRRNAN